jgi:hypothetical protein
LAIVVTKISEALYIAMASPPHVDEPWSAMEPVRLHKLCDELFAKGAHQTDIGDAIDQADRNWLRLKQSGSPK